ncbi:MAG: preprotein translocase SecA subunit, partial [Actinomycetota bacterium]
AQDFVRYVMHVQVVRKDAPQQTVQNLQQTSSDDVPSGGFAAASMAAGLDPAAAAATHRQVSERMAAAAPAQKTVVKDEWSKTSRNAPCPCGSGKKFKMCHGSNA